MSEHPIIRRYLDTNILERAKKDLPSLVRFINRSGGEYSLQVRENCFNIYYQGNSLAKMVPNKNGTYSAYIHEKFLEDKGDRILRKLEQYSDTRKSNKYVIFRIDPGNLHRFFQSSHVRALSSNIRKVHNGEEITYEQVLITDNPPSRNFIIIDRQVADHNNKDQIDISLALRRDHEDNKFHFVVIEVKMGRNPELFQYVAGQLNKYVERIRENIRDYVTCYEINYKQKKQLGLFRPELPDEIKISDDKNRVQGLIVVGGYSQLAKKPLLNLRQEIRQKWPYLNVQQKTNKIKFIIDHNKEAG